MPPPTPPPLVAWPSLDPPWCKLVDAEKAHIVIELAPKNSRYDAPWRAMPGRPRKSLTFLGNECYTPAAFLQPAWFNSDEHRLAERRPPMNARRSIGFLVAVALVLACHASAQALTIALNFGAGFPVNSAERQTAAAAA